MVEKIPDGDYEAESFLDNDGRTLDKPLRVKVKVHVRGSQMTVDFSEMNPQVPGPLNSGRSGGIAGARVAFKALTSPDLDVNEGCFRPLEVILPEGTMLTAKPPAALGLLEHRAADRDRHHPEGAGAGGAAPHAGRAQGRHGRLLVLRLPRRRLALPADEHLRRRLGRTAERGRRRSRSVSVCQGDVRNTPVELQEIKYPVLVETHALRPNSGGDGEHRGGLGVEV